MSNIADTIINSGLLAVLLAVVVALIKYGTAWLDAKTQSLTAGMKHQEAAAALYNAEQAVSNAVVQTAQQEADQLKADAAANNGGKLTADQKKQLVDTAKARAVSLMTGDIMDIVKANVGNFDAWLEALIEKNVRAGKQG